MLRKVLLLATMPAFVFADAASAQKLLAPADPIAAIEGEWAGIRSKSRVRVRNGTVTLVQLDPKDAYHGFTEGMVIGRLRGGGETINDGRGYSFSSSQCLVLYTRNGVNSHKMEPCGARGASLATYVNAYQLYVSGMGFQIPRNGAVKGASSTKPEEAKPKASIGTLKAKEASKPATGELLQSAEKKAKYEAELAAYRQTIADQQEAERRKQSAHAANQQAAAQAQNLFDQKKANHARLIEDHMARERAYQAARRRHTLCVNGNQQACDEIAAGKPAAGEKLALTDAGKASTDTEATTCVSQPVVSSNATFAGNTAATVVNGCPTAVDVRICLMREGGWNCGVKWGLRPQERWSHSSFKASGQIFWDARVSGSSRPLESPGGS